MNGETLVADDLLQLCGRRLGGGDAGFNGDETVVVNIDHLFAYGRGAVAECGDDAAPVRVAAVPGALDEGGVGYRFGRLARILEGRGPAGLHLARLVAQREEGDLRGCQGVGVQRVHALGG